MYGSIKPKGLASRRDIRSDFGGQEQYYNIVGNEKEDLSDTDFYSLSDEDPVAAPVYSVVKKKNVKTTQQQNYLFIEAKIDNNLPCWLKTTSLNRSWRTPLMNSTIPKRIQEEKELVVTKGAPPPPPPRGKRNWVINKKPSWRFQYGSTSSSLGSTSQSMTPSPQISNVPYKKSNNDNGTVRRPTNFDHHPIKCFANSIWKRTSKAFQGSSTSNTSSISRSMKASNENVKCDNNIPDRSLMQEKNNLNKENCSFGSNTSINSVWTEDGRLITPPPRRKFKSQQNLYNPANINKPFNKTVSSLDITTGECHKNHLCKDKSGVETGSNISFNRILTSTGLLTPPERIRSKMQFGLHKPTNEKPLSSFDVTPGEWYKNRSCKDKSCVETGSNISINRILTSTGLLTPPERIRSKMQFGLNKPDNGKTFDSSTCNSPEFKNIQASNKFHSNDSINRVVTPNGIITPPPRKYFNRSTLSLHNPSKCNIGSSQNNTNVDFVPMKSSQSIQLHSKKDKVPIHQTPSSLMSHTKPRVSERNLSLIYQLNVLFFEQKFYVD